MRVVGFIVLLLCIPAMSSCTTPVRRKSLPYPLIDERFPDPVKVVAVPLPVIATTPNEGVTYGALTAFLLHTDEDEVGTLLAPQVNYNENFGVTASVFGSFYLSPERDWEFNVSKSSNVNEDFGIRIRDETFLDKRLSLSLYLFAFTDGAARFFGFGPDSPGTAETNFSDREAGFDLSAGYRIANQLSLVVSERFRRVGIREGAVEKLPFVREVFSPREVPGLTGFTAHAQGLFLVYSTLDSPHFPTRGFFARAGVEGSARILGSTSDYWRYGGEVRGYLPYRDARFVTAARFAFGRVQGGEVPFLERSVLGGDGTLRGFGDGRFIDKAFLLLNVEERIRLLRWRLFKVDADWEMAFFLDVGSVMESFERARPSAFEVNPGFGFRAVVRPNIVGRMDVGFGGEGPEVFIVLDYPY
jgi:outer membrane protein assembly factor BamA